MRSNERYIKRIVIPVISVALLALIINFIMQKQTVEDELQDQPQAERAFGGIQQEQQDAPEFSAEAVDTEVAALQRAVEELATSASQQADSGSEGATAEEAKSLREKAREAIDALRNATEENWEQLYREAMRAVQNYAEAVGSEIRDPAGAAGNP